MPSVTRHAVRHTPRPPPSVTRHAAMLTSAYAHASAVLAAAGQGKKAAQVQLQAELNNNEEWNKFLARDGLLVIDVYTEWCGPCIGMVGNLKKIKVELGGDNLHLAVAKSDTIDCLERFRNRSEPTWMFIAGGQLLNVIFGANAPLITRTIEQELRNEELARTGQRERPQRAPHELTSQEQIAADAQAKLLEERKAKEAAAAAESRLARREARAKRLETHFLDVCPGLMTPHAQKSVRKVADALDPLGVVVADKCPTLLTKEQIKLLAAEDPAFGTEAAAAAVLERPSLTLLLKKLPDREGDVIELCRRALFGDGEEVECEPPKKTLAQELSLGDIPGLFIPTDRHQRAAALDILYPKMVSTLVEPAVPPEPPHVAMVFGAWHRRAMLAAAAAPHVAPLVLRYGFFADGNVDEPKLLCKTIEQYELRPDKDYGETIILMVAVGLAEPALADPNQPIPDGPPKALQALGPLHVSADSVVGAEECSRLFPPGYSTLEVKAKPKSKKKKKKRHTKEDTTEETTEPPTEPDAESVDADKGEEDLDADGDADGDADADADADADDDDVEEAGAVDKATSPPPLTPH